MFVYLLIELYLFKNYSNMVLFIYYMKIIKEHWLIKKKCFYIVVLEDNNHSNKSLERLFVAFLTELF